MSLYHAQELDLLRTEEREVLNRESIASEFFTGKKCRPGLLGVEEAGHHQTAQIRGGGVVVWGCGGSCEINRSQGDLRARLPLLDNEKLFQGRRR